MKGPDGHHYRLRGGGPAAGDGLEGGDQLAPSHDDIAAQVGLSPVGPFPAEGESKGVGGGADGPLTQRHRPRGDAALHVAAEDRVHMGILHAALGNHPRPAAVALLVRLEEELHRPGQGLPPPLEKLRRSQQGGHMEVVAAGVHHPRILRGVGQSRLFLDRQGIHVRPEAQTFPRQCPPDHPHNPGAGHRDGRDAQQLQLSTNQRRSSPLLVPQFRVAVNRNEYLF